MAHKCKATDSRPWISTLKGTVDDGEITIGTENGNGQFKGKHKKTGKDLIGNCFEAGGGKPDKITFVVPDRQPEFLYFGVIDSSGEKITGRRLTFPDAFDAIALTDDDWTAEKPTTKRKA